MPARLVRYAHTRITFGGAERLVRTWISRASPATKIRPTGSMRTTGRQATRNR